MRGFSFGDGLDLHISRHLTGFHSICALCDAESPPLMASLVRCLQLMRQKTNIGIVFAHQDFLISLVILSNANTQKNCRVRRYMLALGTFPDVQQLTCGIVRLPEPVLISFCMQRAPTSENSKSGHLYYLCPEVKLSPSGTRETEFQARRPSARRIPDWKRPKTNANVTAWVVVLSAEDLDFIIFL